MEKPTLEDIFRRMASPTPDSTADAPSEMASTRLAMQEFYCTGLPSRDGLAGILNESVLTGVPGHARVSVESVAKDPSPTSTRALRALNLPTHRVVFHWLIDPYGKPMPPEQPAEPQGGPGGADTDR